MKKVLSFVLVLAMILGSVSMAFADVAVSTKNTVVPFEDAEDSAVATVLRDLGILNGSEGKALLEEPITRAEFCKMILCALGLDSIAKAKAKTVFTDVAQDAWYSGYVATAYAQNLVSGVSATEFMPEEYVTADEAIAFVVKALGYTADHLDGIWPSNFRVQAAKLAIVPEDYDFTVEEATRGDVFAILYEAVVGEANIAKWNKAEEYYNERTGDTILKRCGVANVSYTEDETATLVATNTTLANDFDLSEYAGKKVKFLRKDSTRIGIAEVVTETVKGALDKTQTTFTAIDGVATAYADAVKEAGAVYTLNGEYVTGRVFEAALKKASTSALTVEAELNKNGQPMTWSAVSAWIRTEAQQVTEDDAEYFDDAVVASFAAFNLNGVAYAVEISGAGVDAEFVNFELVGADKFADIDEDAVVEIYAANGKVTKLVVVKDVVTGSITKVTKVAPTKYTMNGKAYSKSSASNAAVENVDAYVTYGTPYAFYLDSEGKIFAGEAVKKETVKTTAYAIYLDGNGTYGKKLTQLANGSYKEDGYVTTYAISILPLGDTEAKEFTYASSKGLDLLDGEAEYGYTYAPGTFIEYTFNAEGVMTSMKAVSFATATDILLGSYSVAGKLVADDAQVVVFATSSSVKYPTMAAAYTVKTYADVKNTTYGAAGYLLNAKSGKVDILMLANKAKAATKATKTTAAAVISAYNTAEGQYADLLVVGLGSVEAVPVTGSAFNNLAKNNIYTITYSGAYVTEVAIAANGVRYTTAEAAKYENNVVYKADKTMAFHCQPDVVVFVYDLKNKVFSVATDINAAIKAAKKSVTTFDFDNDAQGMVDFIVVDYSPSAID